MHGKPPAGSNIIDLVNDTLRQRKHPEPKGWQTFAQMLKESNVPRDYVGNKKRRDFMYGGDEDDDDDGEFQTPSRNLAMRQLIRESAKKQRWIPYDQQY